MVCNFSNTCFVIANSTWLACRMLSEAQQPGTVFQLHSQTAMKLNVVGAVNFVLSKTKDEKVAWPGMPVSQGSVMANVMANFKADNLFRVLLNMCVSLLIATGEH